MFTSGFNQVQLNSYIEEECKMIAGNLKFNLKRRYFSYKNFILISVFFLADRQEKERADARNALEEYVYELRGKLSSEDELASFVTDNDRNHLINQLDQMENWLYEDGEDCNRQEYHDKLHSLKNQGDPIQSRRNEFDMRPCVMEDFAKTIQLAGKAADQIKNKDPKYAHLTDDEVHKLINSIQESHKWLEQTRVTLNSASRYVAPPVTVSQIRTEHTNFENIITPILNKPIPKPPSPPKEEKPQEKMEENPQQNQQNQQAQQSDHHQQQQQQPPEDSKMEWSN